jgi:hypothetical protein
MFLLHFVFLVEVLHSFGTYHFHHLHETWMTEAFQNFYFANNSGRHPPVTPMVDTDLLKSHYLIRILAPSSVNLPIGSLANLLNAFIVSDGPCHIPPVALRSRECGLRQGG